MPKRFYPTSVTAKRASRPPKRWTVILLLVSLLAVVVLLADQMREAAPSTAHSQSARQTIASTQTSDAVTSIPIDAGRPVTPDTPKVDSVSSGTSSVESTKIVEEQSKLEAAPAKPILPSVTLFNGCGVKGIGSRAQAALEKMGFTVVEVRNARYYEYEISEILDRSESRIEGFLLADSLGIKRSAVEWDTTRSDAKADVSLIVGKDYRKLRLKL